MANTVIAGELFHTIYGQSGDIRSVAFICKSNASGDFVLNTNTPNISNIVNFRIESGYGYGYGNDSIPDYSTILAGVLPTNLFDVEVRDSDNQDMLRGDGADVVSVNGIFKYESDSTKLSIDTIGRLKIIGSNMGDSKMMTIKLFYR